MDVKDVADTGTTTAPSSRCTGVVTGGTGGVWDVFLDEGGMVSASLRGRLKHVAHDALKLAVGDRVTLVRDRWHAASWMITEIHPRTSRLSRRNPGGGRGERIVLANLDQVLIVFSTMKPDPHPRMLDRFLLIAEANNLLARIVVNKTDLVSGGRAEALFVDQVAAGYPIHRVSAHTGDGLNELRLEVEHRCSALAGPSGVGKSSIMNTMFPGLDLRTGAVSESVNKGRHTTVGARLHPLPCGGFIADTPGLREVGLWGISTGQVAACFPEFRSLQNTCRFADCTHVIEPGCAIREAVEVGTIARARYDSYVKLQEELGQHV